MTLSELDWFLLMFFFAKHGEKGEKDNTGTGLPSFSPLTYSIVVLYCIKFYAIGVVVLNKNSILYLITTLR